MAARNTVSMQDIADELGISKVTVSKALNGKDGVSEPLRERILQTASERGYVLPDYGQRKSRTVGIIMNGRFNSSDTDRFYMSIYEHIICGLRLHAISGVMLTPDRSSVEKDAEMIGKTGMFDGLILLGILEREVRSRIDRIPLPKVYVDVYDETYRSDSVVTENIYSAYEITNYLIRKGHTKIGFAGTVGATTSISDRYLGYLRALIENGIAQQSEWIISDRDKDGMAAELQLPESLPTAFMCNCDETAFGLLKVLKKRNLSVPDDISVVGFDNDIYAGLCEPELTTVEVNTEEMGRIAVKRIIKCMEKPERKRGMVYRIPGKLICRHSVKELSKEPVSQRWESYHI